MSEEKKRRGRPPGTRKVSAEGRYGRPEISVRMEPDLLEWVKANGGAPLLRQLAAEARDRAQPRNCTCGAVLAGADEFRHHRDTVCPNA